MRVWVNRGFLFALGVLVGLFIADSTTTENVLKEYQTLVTGILAVGAALYTVRQMQMTDERQEERHREMIDFNLEPDRRRVAKAIRNADPFRKNAASFNLFLGGEDERVSFAARVLNSPSEEDRKMFTKAVAFCEHVAKAKNIPAAADLFDPEMNACWTRLVNSAALVEKRRNLMTEPKKSIPYAVGTHKLLRRLSGQVAEMADHLDALAAKYRLNHLSPPSA